MPWSPYKDLIIAYVKEHPGCTKMDVARHISYQHKYGDKMYHAVNTAIRNGWVKSIKTSSGTYKLSPS